MVIYNNTYLSNISLINLFFLDGFMLTVVEAESQPEAKTADNLSVDIKSCKLENDVGSNKILQEVSII